MMAKRHGKQLLWRLSACALLCHGASLADIAVMAAENTLYLAEISFNDPHGNADASPSAPAAPSETPPPPAEAATNPDQPPTPPILFKESNGFPNKFRSGAKTRVRERFDIDGNVGSKYVQAIVDVEDDRYVTGYLYDRKGNKEYIYGEFAYGALHVYDKKGKMYVIQVSRMTR